MKSTRSLLLAVTAALLSVVSSACADEAKENVMSAVSGTTISGYVSTSAIWQFGTGTTQLQSPLLPQPVVNSDTIGMGVFYIPQNFGPDSVTVIFGIAVSTENINWSEGHLFGGNTDWTFDLGTGTYQNGATYYIGSTDVAALQVQDMLAGNTQFEIISQPQNYVLQGNLAAVPEPSVWALLLPGLWAIHTLRRRTVR